MSLNEIVKALADNTQQFQQETRASIQNLGNQITQLATTVGKLESQGSGKLPSQTEVNPRGEVKAITLRNGREIQSGIEATKRTEREETEEEPAVDFSQEKSGNNRLSSVVPPFPSRLAKSKKEDYEREVLETFRKVEINIPLLDAIKQIPRYAKFLKELCTTKKKLKSDEKVSFGKNVSSLFKRELPEKCKDPGMFTIPCVIGNKRIERAMLDLGASINVMPYSIYQALNLGELKETRIIIQLADRSNVCPEGVIEDVLLQVNELIFPVDFYILKMEDDFVGHSAPLLLGRPFMKTAKTKIDVNEGTLSVEFDGEIVKFNIFDAMKYPSDANSLCQIDTVEILVQEIFSEEREEKELDILENLTEKDSSNFVVSDAIFEIKAEEIQYENFAYKKVLPSVLQTELQIVQLTRH